MFAMACEQGDETLEDMVRQAIALGELSPSLAKAIDRYLSGRLPNRREMNILAVLQDAIANGVITPIPDSLPAADALRKACNLSLSQREDTLDSETGD